MTSLQDLSTLVAIGLAIGVTGFVAIISLTIWGFLEMRRGHLELQRGQAELKRLDIVIGGLVYQEDEKIRALITARFDELLRQLPR
jgi:hypothetical protein